MQEPRVEWCTRVCDSWPSSEVHAAKSMSAASETKKEGEEAGIKEQVEEEEEAELEIMLINEPSIKNPNVTCIMTVN